MPVRIAAMNAFRAVAIGVAAAAVVALAAATLLAARRHPAETLGGGTVGALALQVGVALALFAAGVSIAVIRSAWKPGVLIALAGAGVLLAAVPLPDAGGAVLFTAGYAGGAAAAALAGAGSLAYLRRARLLPDGLVAGAALAASGVWLGVLPAATYDPGRAGCFACPANLLLIHGDSTLHDDLVRSGLWAAAIACGALALLSVARWATSAGVVRRVTTPALVGAAGAAAFAAAGFAHEASAGMREGEVDSTMRWLWLAQCGCLAIVAAGVGAELTRARLLSHRIAGIVVGALPSSEALRVALAESAGDPGLSVVYPQNDGSVVDDDGRPAGPAEPSSAVTDVMRGREKLAQLRHAGHLRHAPDRLTEAVRAAGLALEHASSRATLRARLAELTSSRARIVEVGDAERRRLERNLHDGAQQRLIALSVALQRSTDGAPGVVRAREEILAALDELRALAHGIHPASLSDAGVEAALRELAEGSRVPVRLELETRKRLPPPIETALYRVVLDGVHFAERRGDGRAVAVVLSHVPGGLRLLLTLPGVEKAAAAISVEHAFDRVAALDGRSSIERAGSDVTIEVRLPCAS
jgi:signal transduction histidine kinase